MDGESLRVERCAGEGGQHVGSIGGDGHAFEPSVEHLPEAGNSPLHPHFSRERNHDVGTPDQGRGERIDVSNSTYSPCECTELTGCCGMVTNHGNLGLGCLANRERLIVETAEDPWTTGPVRDLACRPVAYRAGDRGRGVTVRENDEPVTHRCRTRRNNSVHEPSSTARNTRWRWRRQTTAVP